MGRLAGADAADQPGDTVHFDIRGRPRPGRPRRAATRTRVRLRHALQPARPGARRGRRSRATRSRSRSSRCRRAAGAGRRCCPELGLLPEDFPEPFIRYFDLTQGDTTELAGRADPDRAVPGHDGHAAGRHRPRDAVPAAQGRRQRRHPPPQDRHDAAAAGVPRRARCSRAATRTPPRATARCAWRRSRPTCGRRCASACASGRSPRPGSVPGPLTPRTDAGGHYGTMGIAPTSCRAPGGGAGDDRAGRRGARPRRARTPTCSAASPAT